MRATCTNINARFDAHFNSAITTGHEPLRINGKMRRVAVRIESFLRG
jgi:hypothetical protein